MLRKKETPLIEITSDDIIFHQSAQAGDQHCRCSRCGKRIIEGERMITICPPVMKEVIRTYYEYRFCERCLTGNPNFDCEQFNVWDKRCGTQCSNCASTQKKINK